ncbi:MULTISPECIES: DoxX family membrane protein [unclassified Mycobacterium]|uniref:DoxX family protein n=1 Tax=unclassified Mycobacterium TaxID=2642494 RepID=UPI00074009CB|nr:MULTISPECIES: DoxX family membrane protein [unclassified Mycobacterium]KUH81040.1 DoxX family protein [Mycobacterium sp. GA-1999]KUH84051.1 DoxX family protein [Mycobacterium sp. IS-1556]KUH89916.1 DoxX family protein [Mycobacterium sp. GA-0227b]
MLIRRIARPMLSAAFIARGVEALRSPKPAADAARPTLEGLSKLPDPVGTNVPANAETVARATAAVQIGGGLLLATGKLPRVASAALALSVVPGSLGGHTFWSETDPQRKADERRAFITDVSLIGGLIIAAVDTEGKPSLGWRGRRAAHKVSEAVTAALPVGAAAGGALSDSAFADKVGHGLHVGAERGRELAGVARERGAELAEVARERGPEIAELARKRGAELADVARERGPEIAEVARKRGAVLADAARERGSEFADVARDRAPELAETARGRAAELAETARKQAKTARKQAEQARKEAKRQQRKLR